MSSMRALLLKRLEYFLDLSAYGQGLITSNSANINTPGDRTRVINVAGEMRKARGAEGDAPALALPQEVKVAGLLKRPDGNYASVDRESMLLAGTQLQFRVGAYPKGFDPAADKSIAKLPALKEFRRRSSTEDAPFERTIEALASVEK